MDRAEVLSATWIKTSRREAITYYEQAAARWTSASDFASAARATLKSGDLYFLFSDYSEALKRYRTVEANARKTNDRTSRANALNRMGRVQSFLGNNSLAQEQITKAIDLFRQSKVDDTDYGDALCNLAEVSYAQGDFIKAREQVNSALEVFRETPEAAAKAHLLRGHLTGSIGDIENAVSDINRARDLFVEANDKIGEALALTTLGLSFSLKRDMQRATELSNQAIEIFRRAGDRHSEAIALNTLGQVYEGIDDYALAIHQYQQSLILFEEIKSADGISVTTFKLARVNNRSGHPDRALLFYDRCLKASRAAGKFRTEANALNEIAKVYESQKRPLLALKQYQKLQQFYEIIGDLRGKATSLNDYVELLAQLGQVKQGVEESKRAVPLSEKAGDKGILISTLYNLGRLELLSGTPEKALLSIQRSLEIIEDLRANVASPDFRVSYFSVIRKHYELCIRILMKLEQLHPAQGFGAEALLVNERGKARLLLDLIRESSNLHQGAAQKLLDRERQLRGLFGVQAQYRMDLILSKKETAEIAAVDSQLAQLRSEYQQIQAQLREQNPHLHSLEQPAQVRLDQIQNELRNDDTMLLEYALGEESSYLWAVTSNSLQSFELPPRKILEETARETYRALTARQGLEVSDNSNYHESVVSADSVWLEKATNLSQMLLGPVADIIGSKRLIVVTEGTLQHIPLDSLPLPNQPEISQLEQRRLLVEQNEVVVLPSISTLIAIRSGRNRTSSPNKLVAIIADPVFNNRDDRVIKNTSRGADPNKLSRLPYTSEEADAIVALAPWGTTLVMKGFDARRENAMSANIGQHQIVHLAAHGFLDNDHPELSGIVLSTIDASGNTTNGIMTLHDINSLALSAELTVLSACQTALGKDIKGEGILGLTHSFISAGSHTVVASLWKVDDRATAALMVDFYKSMLQNGLSPSAALRLAKLKLMKEKGWSAPYYWAGFIPQGEYKNHISVARHSWLRTVMILLPLLSLAIAALLIFRKRRPPPLQST